MPALQAATGDARLMLGRFRMTACVPRDRIAAAEVGTNARAFFADHVAPALKEVLVPLMDSGDPSVWIIRRLDVKIVGDRASGHKEIGRAFARSFRKAMVRAFNGEGNLAAIRFPDRASYLAHFLVDLAEGRAWDRWYYRHFADLRPLPVGAAVRMLLEREEPHAQSAVIKVEERGRLQRLIDQLGENDAHRIYSSLVPPAMAGAAENAAIVAVAEVLLRQPGLLAHGTGYRMRLSLLVTALARLPLTVGAIAAAIDTILTALTAADGSAPALRGQITDAAREQTGETRRPRALAERLQAVLARLRSGASPSAPRRRAAPAHVSSLATPFAGVFLLWRSAVEIGLDRLVAQGLDAPRACLRRLALAARLAGPAWRAALEDEAVQWLAGIAEPPSDDAIAAALTFSDTEHGATGRGLCNRLLDLRPPTPLSLLLQHHGDAVVLQDAQRQDWLAAAADGPPAADLAGAEIAWLLLREGIAIERVPEVYRGWRRCELPDSGFALLAPGSVPPHESTIARARQAIGALRPVGGDLSYFDAGDAAGDPRSALLWAVLARAAHSDLARRLPGLELSSALYLGRNVVQGQGTFARNIGEHDAEVVLPSAPIDLVLRMTGLDRTVLRLDDGRSMLIRLPGP
jgi:hypothetical protein